MEGSFDHPPEVENSQTPRHKTCCTELELQYGLYPAGRLLPAGWLASGLVPVASTKWPNEVCAGFRLVVLPSEGGGPKKCWMLCWVKDQCTATTPGAGGQTACGRVDLGKMLGRSRHPPYTDCKWTDSLMAAPQSACQPCVLPPSPEPGRAVLSRRRHNTASAVPGWEWQQRRCLEHSFEHSATVQTVVPQHTPIRHDQADPCNEPGNVLCSPNHSTSQDRHSLTPLSQLFGGAYSRASHTAFQEQAKAAVRVPPPNSRQQTCTSVCQPTTVHTAAIRPSANMQPWRLNKSQMGCL